MTDKNKGGRPRKENKKSVYVKVLCTVYEKKTIEILAGNINLSVSEYLRELGLNGKFVSKQKILPKEVLAFTGQLNHAAANLNQFAKLNNQFHNFNAIERAEMKVLCNILKGIATEIKVYLLN